MIRRLAKPVAVLLALGCVSVVTQYADYLEAVTANLNTLLDSAGTPQGTLTEGDKTFSNFTFSSSQSTGPGATVSLPNTNVTVTAVTGPGGTVTLSVPLSLSASSTLDFAQGVFNLGFNVTVSGSDLISAVTVGAMGTETPGPDEARITTNFFDAAGNRVAFFIPTAPNEVSPPDTSERTPIDPNLPFLRLAATGVVNIEDDGAASISNFTFSFEQTSTSSTVPEPGALTLILGGLGMLIARGLYQRRG
jgi:hypothetical protein